MIKWLLNEKAVLKQFKTNNKKILINKNIKK